MFTRGTRGDIYRTPKKAKQKATRSFISFRKKGAPGEHQENKVVFKVSIDKEKDNRVDISLFVGNPYDIGVVEYDGRDSFKPTNRVIALQDVEGNLYLVPTMHGAAITPTKTWSRSNVTTLARYYNRPKSYFPIDRDNEYIFNVDGELTEFISNGEGIEGEKFEGYKLTYIKSFFPTTPVIEVAQTEAIESLRETIDDIGSFTGFDDVDDIVLD